VSSAFFLCSKLFFHDFDIKVFNFNVETEFFYSKTMENYISIISRNHGIVIMEEKKCLNVLNVELTFQI
jgi:hypothetical protein